MESNRAVQLCVGALSLAPALCVEAAEDQLNIDESSAVRLCQGATSNEPVACAAELEADQATTEFVPFCAALPYPIVPDPSPGNAACVRLGTDTTSLSDDEVLRLCRGSVDTTPVACFQAGADQTTLDDHDLVTLCAAAMIYSPTAPIPGGGY